MLTSESKVFLESYFLLQKQNEDLNCNCDPNNDSLMLELNKDEKEKDDMSISIVSESVGEIFMSDDKLHSNNASQLNSSCKKEESTCDPSQSDLSKLSNFIEDINNFENLSIDIVEPSYNVADNYQDYVFKALKSLSKIKELSFNKEIIKRSCEIKSELTKKHTLALDLDETLIHVVFEGESSPMISTCEFHATSFYDRENEIEVNLTVILRPGVHEFLQEAAKHFELGIFTASIREYADAILSILDPNQILFSFRLCRESCIKLGHAYIKDLRIISDRNPAKIALLDNSIYSFANQLSNGVLINSFYNNPKDRELTNIIGYLIEFLVKCDDIRFVNEQVFRFQTILEEIS